MLCCGRLLRISGRLVEPDVRGMLVSLELLKPNHAYLKDDKPSLSASPVTATGFRKIYCWASFLEGTSYLQVLLATRV